MTSQHCRRSFVWYNTELESQPAMYPHFSPLQGSQHHEKSGESHGNFSPSGRSGEVREFQYFFVESQGKSGKMIWLRWPKVCPWFLGIFLLKINGCGYKISSRFARDFTRYSSDLCREVREFKSSWLLETLPLLTFWWWCGPLSKGNPPCFNSPPGLKL